MAELEGSTQMVPVGTSEAQYAITVTEYDAAGKSTPLTVPFPRDPKSASVLLRAAVLKQTTWKAQSIPQIIHAVWYADQMGLDIMAGDVYTAAEGRISTTTGAKIRHAMSTHMIEGYEIEITPGDERKFEYSTKQGTGSVSLPNYQARVTVHVKGWKKPNVYETELAEWFEGRNPNWRTRPKYMLRRNALSKALEEVAPMGVEADEAPAQEVASANAQTR